MKKTQHLKANWNQIVPIAIIGATFSFFIISTINYRSEYWYPWLVFSRAMMGGLALIFISILAKRPARYPWIDTIYITIGLAVQASHGILESYNSVEFYQFTAFFYIAAAISYKGSFRDWLRIFCPIQSLCVLAPLMVKERALGHSLPQIVDIYSITIAALFIGTAIARLSATKYETLERNIHLQQRLIDEGAERQRKYEQFAMLFTQVAHDIRSPLSSMKAGLEMLRRQCGMDKEVGDSLNLLQLSSNRLNNIANGLLAKYKGEESVSQAFSIHEVLDELIGELQSSPLGQGVVFKKEYHQNALYISGDRTGINRAIGNIIKNALEAMQRNPSDKPKRLVVTTTLNSPSPGLRPTSPTRGEVNTSDAIVLRIIDTGPGIPADKIPLILQGGHSEGKSDGHGIGTKVVSEVVSVHHGHLDIESEVGVGTTFIITLPAILCHEDMTVTIPVIASPEGAWQSRVVVIDDEPSLREQWRLTLKSQGVVPQLFSCWEEYIACHREPREAGRGDPECTNGIASAAPRNDTTFIIDYHFDNSLVDGLEIIRRLKAQGHTQFILATAEYWKPAIKESAKELGITLCPKPLPKIVIASETKQSSEFTGLAAAPSEPRNDKTCTSILLIDDDPAMHMAWKMKCKMWGVPHFQAFLNMEDCTQSPINYTAIDAAFIDKNIKDSSWALDKTIAHLKSNGVQKVWIASGESTKELQSDPLCAAADGVVKGKMPDTLEDYLNERL